MTHMDVIPHLPKNVSDQAHQLSPILFEFFHEHFAVVYFGKSLSELIKYREFQRGNQLYQNITPVGFCQTVIVQPVTKPPDIRFERVILFEIF